MSYNRIIAGLLEAANRNGVSLSRIEFKQDSETGRFLVEFQFKFNKVQCKITLYLYTIPDNPIACIAMLDETIREQMDRINQTVQNITGEKREQNG